MKKFKLPLTTLLLCMVVQLHSQSNHEFIIIDEIADNAEMLISAFGNQPNVYVTDGITTNALGQILKHTENLQINDLHIYVLTKPGAMVFNSIALTVDNINDWSSDLEALGGIVSNKVVIHSEVVFTGEEGALLKERLEDISGLLFTTEN